MSKSNYYTPSNLPICTLPEVEHQQWSTSRDVYIGDAVALVASGVIQEHMLPAPGHIAISWRAIGAKQPGRSAHREPGYITVRRMPFGGGFRVEVVVSEGEQRLRQQAAERARAQSKCAQTQAMSAVKGAQEALSKLPPNHQAFRDKFAEHLYTFVVAGRSAVADCLSGSGYSLDNETWTEFLEEFCEALGTITQGSSTYDAAKRTAHVAELQAKIAANDVGFRPFLARILSPIGDDSESADRG